MSKYESSSNSNMNPPLIQFELWISFELSCHLSRAKYMLMNKHTPLAIQYLPLFYVRGTIPMLHLSLSKAFNDNTFIVTNQFLMSLKVLF